MTWEIQRIEDEVLYWKFNSLISFSEFATLTTFCNKELSEWDTYLLQLLCTIMSDIGHYVRRSMVSDKPLCQPNGVQQTIMSDPLCQTNHHVRPITSVRPLGQKSKLRKVALHRPTPKCWNLELSMKEAAGCRL